MGEITHLRKPELDLKFARNADGSYSATIVLGQGDSESQIPLREVARKHMQNLESAVGGELLAQGVPYRLKTLSGEASLEAGGKLGVGGKLGGGGDIKAESDGALKKLGAKVGGGLNGAGDLNATGEISGKAGLKASFEIQPGSAGLSRELQANLRDVLARRSDQIFLDWAKDHAAEGTSVPLGHGKSLKVPPAALDAYVREHQPMLDRLMDRLKPHGDAGPAQDSRMAGFSDPAHPYHALYESTLTQLGPLASRLDGRPAAEVAAALTLSAANAKFDPDKPLLVAAGNHAGTVFAIQGAPDSPASARVSVDAAQMKAPSPEQMALAQPPAAAQAQADPIAQRGPSRN